MKKQKTLPVRAIFVFLFLIFSGIVFYYLVGPAFYDGSSNGGGLLSQRPAPWALSAADEQKFQFTENEARGRYHFQQYCSSCHGPEGRGNGPQSSFLNTRPRSFIGTQGGFVNGLTPGGIIKTLNEGIPGSQMPLFPKLPEDVKSQIADFVIYLNTHPALF